MKHVFLSLAFIVAMGLTSCKEQANKTATSSEVETTETVETIENKTMAMADISFGVRGNCGMCKTTIEKAANSVDGVSSANWDVDKKAIAVSFDESKTNAMAIHKAIAASGYDTDKMEGNMEAYRGLAKCCQYDHEMEMNK